MNPFVCILILTWNHLGDTLECLDSIARVEYPNYRVVVVDNASTDNTVQVLRRDYPWVTVLQNSSNLGYAEGNNVGIRYALEQNADYILVLNNDTVVNPGFLAYLVEDLEAHPQAAAASPVSFFYSEPDVIYFAGGKLNPQGGFLHPGMFQKGDAGFSTPLEVDWLNGCAILIRSSAISAIGFFDPKFFLLFEDADWSLRAGRAGYTLRAVPQAHIWHKSSQSFGETWSPVYSYYYARNRLLCYAKNFSSSKRLWFFYQEVHRDFSPLIKGLAMLAGRTAKGRAIRQGYLDYFLRRFGKRDYHW